MVRDDGDGNSTLMQDATSRGALALVLLIGATLRLAGLGFGLPHPLTRPDEEVLVSKALGFFSGDLNPHFFEWPSLYFYVTHAIMWVEYAVRRTTGGATSAADFVQQLTVNPQRVYEIGRFLSVACGVLTLLAIERLGREVSDRRNALIGAFLLAVTYLHVRDSHFFTLEVPMTLLCVLSVRQLVLAWRRNVPVFDFSVAAIYAGLATSIKYNAAALVAPAIVAVCLRLVDRRKRPRTLLGATAFVCVATACFFAGTPYALLDSSAFTAGLQSQVDRLATGHGGIRIANGWLHHTGFSLRHGLGDPLMVSSIAGTAAFFGCNWRAASMLCSFPIAYFAVIGSGHTAFVRYATPLVPFLALTAALAIAYLTEALAGQRRPLIRIATMVLAAVLVALPSVRQAVCLDRLLTERDTRVLAADWLASTLPADATLYQAGWIYAQPFQTWTLRRPDVTVVRLEGRAGEAVTQLNDATKPEWVVVPRSPLRIYTPVSPELKAMLDRDYVLVQQFKEVHDVERASWFDQQDAFFLPFSNLTQRIRPGPALDIYRLRRP